MLKLVKRRKAALRGAMAGYQVTIDAPGSRYAAHRLVSPRGDVVTESAYFGAKGAEDSDAWRDLPQDLLPRDGYAEDYITTETGRLRFFDERDTRALRQTAYDHGVMVEAWLALTAEDIQRLMAGEAVLWCGENAAVVIHAAVIEDDDCR